MIRVLRKPAGVRLVDEEAGLASSEIAERAADERAEAARREGRAAGEACAIEGAAGILEQAAAKLDRSREEAVEALSRTAAELAVEIARHLVGAAIETGRVDLEALVRESLAVAGSPRGENVVVHLNPTDAEALSGVSFRPGTEIQADAEVARGQVHIANERGLLVHDPERAISMIAERIWGELR